ncbi:hypothetical protein VOLCADRAFT_89824 [Volvox carteri f. nagariensis]|uniref:Uncharacterized protein n=1 Tax=Volvox carteri f. nagariensis TaxID=3068 RepID=D8TSR4_VOLCA|nr:uncharacterized protein VOLCADRAFT_89824 [Volvox carteri f. nagariensis]EFJ49533.1 hypothetical protein VOLCADRAFT_89824 [Volvox carteri f. nagariensis]|eukprot:XP_002949514.1 hypothetical protein VOLCADRAFT_89824 [Volvox carteri f. nagariensis]
MSSPDICRLFLDLSRRTHQRPKGQVGAQLRLYNTAHHAAARTDPEVRAQEQLQNTVQRAVARANPEVAVKVEQSGRLALHIHGVAHVATFAVERLQALFSGPNCRALALAYALCAMWYPSPYYDPFTCGAEHYVMDMTVEEVQQHGRAPPPVDKSCPPAAYDFGRLAGCAGGGLPPPPRHAACRTHHAAVIRSTLTHTHNDTCKRHGCRGTDDSCGMAFPRVLRSAFQWIGTGGLFLLPRLGPNIVPHMPAAALAFGCNQLFSLACEVDRVYMAEAAAQLARPEDERGDCVLLQPAADRACDAAYYSTKYTGKSINDSQAQLTCNALTRVQDFLLAGRTPNPGASGPTAFGNMCATVHRMTASITAGMALVAMKLDGHSTFEATFDCAYLQFSPSVPTVQPLHGDEDNDGDPNEAAAGSQGSQQQPEAAARRPRAVPQTQSCILEGFRVYRSLAKTVFLLEKQQRQDSSPSGRRLTEYASMFGGEPATEQRIAEMVDDLNSRAIVDLADLAHLEPRVVLQRNEPRHTLNTRLIMLEAQRKKQRLVVWNADHVPVQKRGAAAEPALTHVEKAVAMRIKDHEFGHTTADTWYYHGARYILLDTTAADAGASHNNEVEACGLLEDGREPADDGRGPYRRLKYLPAAVIVRPISGHIPGTVLQGLGDYASRGGAFILSPRASCIAEVDMPAAGTWRLQDTVHVRATLSTNGPPATSASSSNRDTALLADVLDQLKTMNNKLGKLSKQVHRLETRLSELYEFTSLPLISSHFNNDFAESVDLRSAAHVVDHILGLALNLDVSALKQRGALISILEDYVLKDRQGLRAALKSLIDEACEEAGVCMVALPSNFQTASWDDIRACLQELQLGYSFPGSRGDDRINDLMRCVDALETGLPPPRPLPGFMAMATAMSGGSCMSRITLDCRGRIDVRDTYIEFHIGAFKGVTAGYPETCLLLKRAAALFVWAYKLKLYDDFEVEVHGRRSQADIAYRYFSVKPTGLHEHYAKLVVELQLSSHAGYNISLLLAFKPSLKSGR